VYALSVQAGAYISWDLMVSPALSVSRVTPRAPYGRKRKSRFAPLSRVNECRQRSSRCQPYPLFVTKSRATSVGRPRKSTRRRAPGSEFQVFLEPRARCALRRSAANVATLLPGRWERLEMVAVEARPGTKRSFCRSWTPPHPEGTRML
jgi:hypothetical protein